MRHDYNKQTKMNIRYLWFCINTRYKDELPDEHAHCQVSMYENAGFPQESESKLEMKRKNQDHVSI